MARVLVVTNPFGDFGRGDRISDPAQIDAILAGHNRHHVIQTDHVDLDEPADSAAPESQDTTKAAKPAKS